MNLENCMNWWLSDLFEDDPLPDEIHYVYFAIVHDKVGYHLELRGSEIKNTNNFGYHPLEGQYFFYDYPADISIFREEAKLAIENLPFFEGRTVYILEKGKLEKIV